jgi:hypothetical protein
MSGEVGRRLERGSDVTRENPISTIMKVEKRR